MISVSTLPCCFVSPSLQVSCVQTFMPHRSQRLINPVSTVSTCLCCIMYVMFVYIFLSFILSVLYSSSSPPLNARYHVWRKPGTGHGPKNVTLNKNNSTQTQRGGWQATVFWSSTHTASDFIENRKTNIHLEYHWTLSSRSFSPTHTIIISGQPHKIAVTS